MRYTSTRELPVSVDRLDLDLDLDLDRWAAVSVGGYLIWNGNKALCRCEGLLLDTGGGGIRFGGVGLLLVFWYHSIFIP